MSSGDAEFEGRVWRYWLRLAAAACCVFLLLAAAFAWEVLL